MKNPLFLFLIMLPLLAACSNNLQTDFEDKDTAEFDKTAALLESLLENPVVGDHLMPWCMHCSSLTLPGVTMFNDALKESEAVEFFKRDNCFDILTSKYQAVIKEEGGIFSSISFFEMLLASDLCMDALNESEKNTLMAMALERLEYEQEYVNEPCHIMIAIMQSCNFAPFMKDIQPKLQETTSGYTFDGTENRIYCGLTKYHADILMNYANLFVKK